MNVLIFPKYNFCILLMQKSQTFQGGLLQEKRDNILTQSDKFIVMDRNSFDTEFISNKISCQKITSYINLEFLIFFCNPLAFALDSASPLGSFIICKNASYISQS